MAKIYNINVIFFAPNLHVRSLVKHPFKDLFPNSIKRICSYSIQQCDYRGRPPDECELE